VSSGARAVVLGLSLATIAAISDDTKPTPSSAGWWRYSLPLAAARGAARSGPEWETERRAFNNGLKDCVNRPSLVEAVNMLCKTCQSRERIAGVLMAGTIPRYFHFVLLCAVLLWACGSDSDTHPGSGGGGGIADASADADVDMPPTPCDGAFAAGNSTVHIDLNGSTRTYLLHVPSNLEAKQAVPLVLNYHGYGSSAAQQAAFSDLDATADSEGFIAAYPEGVSASWNAGQCCGEAFNTGVDDVAFARALVADVQKKLCIDAHRVYAIGMSNGGFMVQRLACDAADVFAAVAPVAGVLTMPQDDCKPSRPISMIHFHGSADTVVRYDGGGLAATMSVADSYSGWVQRDGCSDEAPETFRKGVAHCVTHSNADAGVDVTLCTIDGGGHCWPGQSICPYGTSTTDISVNVEGWNFLKRFTLP
jgi:polyhydroxybutyrate depolymerase